MKVAVLGAGIQGCCLALELASRDVQVDLYDRNSQPFTQASLLNEAKVHLGFFYGNAPSMQTARLIMQGALTFQPLLRGWLGDEVDNLPVSQPYIYAVHRDSLVTAADVKAHLLRTSDLIADAMTTGADYFGTDPSARPEALNCADGIFDESQIVAAYQTPELAVSAGALAHLMRSRVQREPGVRCVLNATVTAATRGETSASIDFELRGEHYSETYDHVVNALWDGRLKVDATAGVVHQHPWLFRTKYNLHLPAGALQTPIPAVSFVLGAFGDVVQYGGSEAYLSWYPAGLKAVTSNLAPEPFAPCLDGDAAASVRDATLDALSALMPSLRGVQSECREHGEVMGGVIFAWGETDITDPRSELHSRHDVGPRSYGRYHSIDTGKFTLAPLFARRMADTLLAG